MMYVIEDRSSSSLEEERPKSVFERSAQRASIFSEVEIDLRLRASRACLRRVMGD